MRAEARADGYGRTASDPPEGEHVEIHGRVIPWDGIPLADILARFKPTSKAKYVEFTTLYDPKRMPGQRYRVLNWPYVEGLRMDEAMHPLSFIAVGVYGKSLPNQNGAPLRLVVPWNPVQF